MLSKKIVSKVSIIFFFILVLTTMSFCTNEKVPDRPNIVYILVDDMGYGDVQILNPVRGRIPTPYIDQLAREGMVFTDAHTASSVCTPSRYGLLTGRYCWRTRLQRGVLHGNSEPLIDEDRMTVASFLKDQGYHTACIGKWHLGMNMPTLDGGSGKEIDFRQSITRGPNTVGFDYFYGIAASLDMAPYVYIENNQFTAVPTRIDPGKKGLAFYRPGPMADNFEMVEVLPHLTEKAIAFIRENAGQDKPFFLYFPMPAPHTPIIPKAEFKGKTTLGDYGDFCVEVDAMVGKVLTAIGEAGISRNTLVVFTSDNGCSRAARFDDLEALGHYPSAQFRGMKADIYEGGHRVPFIMRWPAKIKAGTQSDKILCLTDFLATCADLFNKQLPDNAGEDSQSMLPEMLGQAKHAKERSAVVHHSIHGGFAIRDENWKLELCPGSCGWSSPRPGSKEEAGLPDIQLYNLSKDIAEQNNLQDEYPEVVERMTSLLQSFVDEGRSTPGSIQENATEVDIHWGESFKK